ncbi:MAG: hypothetical protein ABL888_16600 [Pirellulaceae bacterium]
MNKFDRAMIRLLLVFFPLISIATATAWSQDNLPQENEVDPAFREDASDDRETQLKKERIRSVMAELGPKEIRVLQGNEQVFGLLDAQKRLCTALLDFHNEPEKIISILEQQVKVTKKIETDRKTRLEQGVGRPDEFAGATYFRADAELQLLRAQQKFNVVEGNHQPLPIPQLENAPKESDQFRAEVPNELGLPGGRALLKSGDGNPRQAPQDDSIDEWMKGTYWSIR